MTAYLVGLVFERGGRVQTTKLMHGIVTAETEDEALGLFIQNEWPKEGGFVLKTKSVAEAVGWRWEPEEQAKEAPPAVTQEVLDKVREALEEAVDLFNAIREGEYKPDSFTTQPLREALSLLPGKEGA
jgi:hypothetical protein